MQTEVLRVSADAPEPELLARAAAVLRRGGLVAFPTETVYGLGAPALDAEAVARIYAAKGRPAHNPIIVHVAHVQEVSRVVADWPPAADQLAARFWPGPLTLVLPRQPSVPDIITAGLSTVGVRVPAHPVARGLIEAAGLPLAAPSANRSMQLSPTRAEHVLRGLSGRIDLMLDAGPTPGGLESTVLDLTTTPPRLLRPGLISLAELEAVLGTVQLLQAKVSDTQPLPAPGMLSRHYAPQAPLEGREDDGRARVEEWRLQGLRVGWLTFTAPAEPLPGVVVQVMPADPADYAAQLYAVLHALDEAAVERIVVALPPDTPEWLAVRDRLRRAATPA
jgi:L-threonylcarbamoyladenylate synthase